MAFDLPSRQVLLDCDDVLLDWIAGFIPFARNRLGLDVDPRGPGQFDLTPWLKVKSHDEMRAILRKFNEGSDTGFDALPPIPGAVTAIRELRESGLTLRVITSCSADPAVRLRRCENLENVFGRNVFDEIICLDMGVSKADALRAQPMSTWIEDLPKNALEGHRIGHRACVLSAHHNGPDREGFLRQHDLPWFEDWTEVMNGFFRHAEASLEPGSRIELF